MPAPALRRFKAAIYPLLAVNLVLYALLGRASEVLDAAAWVALLALFEIETAHAARLTPGRRRLVHLLRLGASAAVLAAAVIYVAEEEWLDAANAWLWLAVVALLEFEVRHPAAVTRRRGPYVAATAALYAALLALVPAWLWQSAWLNAWDATLWLAAFFAIELDVLGYAA